MGRARRGKRGGARLRRTMQTVGAQSSANAVRQRKKKKKKIAPYTAITPQMAAIVIQRWYLDCVLLHRGARSPHRLVVVAVHTVTLRAPGFVGRREGSASSRMCARSWRCLVSSEPGNPCDRS